jgi:hypothetical protein
VRTSSALIWLACIHEDSSGGMDVKVCPIVTRMPFYSGSLSLLLVAAVCSSFCSCHCTLMLLHVKRQRKLYVHAIIYLS